MSAAKAEFGEEIQLAAMAVEEADGDGDIWAADQMRGHAALLCLLDTAGVGGRDGVEGASTTRLPCFSGLGKGRKQASDGEAWTSAIRMAAGQLLPCPYFYAPTGGGLGLATGRETEQGAMISMSVSPDRLMAASLGAWALTVAREGLRRNHGLKEWHPCLTFDLWSCLEDHDCLERRSEERRRWAKLVNELHVEPQPPGLDGRDLDLAAVEVKNG